ncbi:hypothetical protein FB45DRAFT_796794 [Roridomyces roridus]|uniref:Cell wall protein n=1 Tax=Roridomyces roridus TaxID=1738132 RepID=A0AAD7BLR9_9AGAR|nr:hypothetical protein FB45DRAFT_796794 [Roridomyces roridus]
MMTRISSILFAIIFIFSIAIAAPIHDPRQIGDLACNVARLKIVTALATSKGAINKIPSSDATTSTQVSAAQAGLSSASQGIETIAGAILTGQQAPAPARDQVLQGLATAQSALGNVTDPAASASVASAQKDLANTVQAGQEVIANCK